MPRRREDVNKRIGTILAHDSTRSVVQSTLTTSGTAIDASGSGDGYSTSNLRALSQAVAEACEHLDVLLREIYGEDEDNDSGGASTKFLDYIEKIERYINHRVPDEGLGPFLLSVPQWQRVTMAAEVSKAVRKCRTSSETQSLAPASWNGSRKTMIVRMCHSCGSTILVIGIRGTVSTMDWAVNSNTSPAEAPELGESMFCHRGFLGIARRMEAMVIKAIKKETLSISEQLKDVIFTGHSAGAAVAQILFGFACSTTRSTALSQAVAGFNKIDCIVFASPPVTLPSIPCPDNSFFLLFINEGDPVGLAQPAYVTCLLEAYARTLPREPTRLEMPDPYYRISGTCVVLRDVASDEAEEVEPKAFSVEPAILNRALFGNPVLHSMREYLNRVNKLRELAEIGVSSSTNEVVPVVGDGLADQILY